MRQPLLGRLRLSAAALLIIDFHVSPANTAAMARVVIEHLTKLFPGPNGTTVRGVEDLSLSVENQELLVLVGPSGCGKTTTLRLLAGLEAPTTGSIAIDGQPMDRVPAKGRNLAMVFQNPALYPHLTAYENLAFGLKLRKCSKAEIERRVSEAAEMLGLADCLERLPMALSGGQRQRVALGRALVRRPGLFLFDEPLSNLDPALRSQLRLEIRRLHQRLQTTSVYVTHDQFEAMTLGDRVAVLRQGKLEQLAAPLVLYSQPANLFVAGFIGSPPMNFVRGALRPSGEVLCFEAETREGADASGRLSLPVAQSMAVHLRERANRAAMLGLRPEHIQLQAVEPGTGHAVAGLVELVEPVGAEAFVHVRCAWQSLVARAPGPPRVHAGEKISLRFDMTQAHFFDAANEQALCTR
jgi:multiple sugar transport system ATP-binding protein